MRDQHAGEREASLPGLERPAQELPAEQAEAARAGAIALAGPAGNEPQSLQGHECLVFFLGGEAGGDRK